MNGEGDKEERKEGAPAGTDGVDNGRMDDEGGESMMNCPICTYLNSSSNANCEVCDSPLH